MNRRHADVSGPDQLARMLGGWTDHPGSLPERLARALRQLVQLGELVPGTRLPSERALATALVVSRATVVSGYDLLHGEGLLDPKPGSGHWIAGIEATTGAISSTLVSFPWPHRLAPPESAVRYAPHVVDLSAIAMPASPVLLEVLSALTVADWASVTEEAGYVPLGWPPLRHVIAEECTARGLLTTSQQVMITSGAQQGLSLVAAAFIRPGDVVVVEDPLYPGQLPVLRGAGARLRSVPVTSQGLDVTALSETMESDKPRLALLSPIHHNPTGFLLNADGRTRIAALAGEGDAVIVELYASSDLSLDDHPVPPPVAAIGNADSMIVIGSLSPLVWSGLRVGWIRAPEHLLATLGRAKAVADLGTSLLPQVVALRLMDRQSELRRHRNSELAARCDQAVSLLGRLLPEFEVTRPHGGACLWVGVPAGDASTFGLVALRHGVAVLPGPLCSSTQGHGQRFRMSFACDPTRLLVGIERLAAAWTEYRRQAH